MAPLNAFKKKGCSLSGCQGWQQTTQCRRQPWPECLEAPGALKKKGCSLSGCQGLADDALHTAAMARVPQKPPGHVLGLYEACQIAPINALRFKGCSSCTLLENVVRLNYSVYGVYGFRASKAKDEFHTCGGPGCRPCLG